MGKPSESSGGCVKCLTNSLRICLIIVNIVFIVAGLILAALGIYFLVTSSVYSDSSIYITGSVIFLVCGIGTVLVSIVGIIGSARNWWILLSVYVVLMGLIGITEIVSGGLGFGYKSTITSSVPDSLFNAIDNYRPSESDSGYNPYVNNFINAVQNTFECCGVNSPLDWARNPRTLLPGNYPQSCSCEEGANCVLGQSTSGCSIPLSDFVDKGTTALGAIGIGFGFIQLVSVALALVLCIFRMRK